jgi:hypothetical protein
VYVQAANATLAVFRRDTATGALTYTTCYGAFVDACQDTGVTPGDGFAVSQDGRSVYVTHSIAQAIDTLDRDPATGELAPAGCLTTNPATQGCLYDSANQDALDAVADIAVAPDGKSVVALGNQYSLYFEDHDRVVSLIRHPDDSLTIGQCFRRATQGSCAGADTIFGLRSLAISPDNFSVYTTSEFDTSLVAWTRSAPPRCMDVTVNAVSGLQSDLDLGCTTPFLHPATAQHVVTGPAHGSVATPPSAGKLRYTPTSGFTGEDGADLTLTNDVGDSQTLHVRILVAPQSGPPVCGNVTQTVAHDTPTVVQLQCAGPPGQTVSYVYGQASHGRVDPPTASGAITYTPETGYEGDDSFGYRGHDADGDGLDAMVHLTVRAGVRGLVSGRMTACAGDDGVMRLADSCPGGQQTITWNDTTPGPDGPRGDAGTAQPGEQGPRGRPGIALWPRIHEVRQRFTGRLEGAAYCGPGEKVIGGGVEPSQELYENVPQVTPLSYIHYYNPVIWASAPLADGNGWYGIAGGSSMLDVVADCIKDRP